MAHNLVRSLDTLGDAATEVPKEHQYWNAANHTENDQGENYLRMEAWKPDIEEYMLPGCSVALPISTGAASAMLRYVEELKMYAALNDEKQQHVEGAIESMKDPAWLDAQYQRILVEWPESPTRKIWLKDLNELQISLEEKISEMKDGAFVKLSVRSPKDSAQYVTKFNELLAQGIRDSDVKVGSEEALSDTVKVIKYAMWMAMRVDSGEEALQLLLRSDRIYVDILQAELFSQKNNDGEKQDINLMIHVSEFFTGFHPDWEFRGFVSNKKRTGLTAYNPWVYDKHLLENKAQVLNIIEVLWDKVESKVRSDNYSIDFAVSPKLNGDVWIVEINNFLPPLAGSGLFVYQDADDRKLIQDGPFSFRLKTGPVTTDDFVSVRTDEKGRTRTLTMQPAPDHVMLYVTNLRRAKEGLKPLHNKSEDPTSSKCSIM